MSTPIQHKNNCVIRTARLLQVAGAVALFSLVLPVSADIIGYWRFEDGGFQDNSAGSQNDLSLEGGTEPSSYTLPSDGQGSDFPNPVPQTGEANETAAQLDGGYFRSGDVTGNSFGGAEGGRTMTFEAFFNLDSVRDGHQTLGSIFNDNSERIFYYSIHDGGNLRFSLNYGSGGANNHVDNTGFVAQAGVDYYTAAVVTGNEDNDVIFYFQDLSDQNSSLLSNTISFSDAGSGNFIQTTQNLDIGQIAVAGDSSYFDGVLDEVRVSTAALSEDQLLIIPEPGTLFLLGIAGLALLLGHRRRRA